MTTANISVENFQAYPDHSGVCALVRVDGLLFSCWLTSEVKVHTVQSKSGNISPGKRRLALAQWAFEKALTERTTPEYRAATAAVYATP